MGKKQFKGAELRNKTLAVLGLGRIGAEVAKRAQAFEMTVIAYDPYLTEERAKELEIEKSILMVLFPGGLHHRSHANDAVNQRV